MQLAPDSLFYGIDLTEEQRVYVNSILKNRFTIVNAKSGSGKTTLAVGAAHHLQQKLTYVFSPVEEGKMGFRPGSQKEKEEEYYQPLKDALLEINENPERVIYDENDLSREKNGTYWVYPKSHIFARGTNLKDQTVIIEEAQNFTRGELKKLLTRIHDSCHVVMIGHSEQCDLKDKSKSGFAPYLEHFKNEDYVQVCELTKNFRGELSQKADALVWD